MHGQIEQEESLQANYIFYLWPCEFIGVAWFSVWWSISGWLQHDAERGDASTGDLEAGARQVPGCTAGNQLPGQQGVRPGEGTQKA